jgi:hypothetical protein
VEQRGHPQAYDFGHSSIFQILVFLHYLWKTSTQKLSHSFLRLDISAIDNISKVMLLNQIKFCFSVTERLLKWPSYKWKVRTHKNQMKTKRGHSCNKSQNLSRKTAAEKRNY